MVSPALTSPSPTPPPPPSRFLESFEEVRNAYIQELRELPEETANARRAWNTELAEEKKRRMNSKRRAARSHGGALASLEIQRDSGLQDGSSVAGDESEEADDASTANEGGEAEAEAAEAAASAAGAHEGEYVDADGRSLERKATVYRRPSLGEDGQEAKGDEGRDGEAGDANSAEAALSADKHQPSAPVASVGGDNSASEA